MRDRHDDSAAAPGSTAADAALERLGDILLLRLVDRTMTRRFGAYNGHDRLLEGLEQIGDDLADESDEAWEDGRHLLGWDRSSPPAEPLAGLVARIAAAERLRDTSQRLDDGDTAAWWDDRADRLRGTLRTRVEQLTALPFDRLSALL